MALLRGHSLALGVTLATAACVDGRDPDARSDYLDLYLDEGIEACGGQLDAYDRFVERIFDVWTGQDPGDFRGSVYVLDSPPTNCGGHLGCTVNDASWLSTNYGEYHELTHLMHLSVDGASSAPLQEGVAEALGPLEGHSSQPVDLGELARDFLFEEIETLDIYDYVASAMFTRFLVERHGVDAFRTYFRAIGSYDEPQPVDVATEFQSAFDETIDDAWPAFTSSPRCAYDFWYCDAGTDIDLPHEFTGIECEAPETIGFSAPSLDEPPETPYARMQILHLELPDTLTVEMSLEHIHIGIFKCGDCSEQAPAVHVFGDEPGALPLQVELQPGTYALVVMSRGEGTPRMDIHEAT